VSQQLRADIPSLAAHFEALEEALNPDNEIEVQYYPTTSVVSTISTPTICLALYPITVYAVLMFSLAADAAL
jgi:hypothetical protein